MRVAVQSAGAGMNGICATLPGRHFTGSFVWFSSRPQRVVPSAAALGESHLL